MLIPPAHCPQPSQMIGRSDMSRHLHQPWPSRLSMCSITISRSCGSDQVPVGHIPRSMTIHLYGTRTRSVNPGDVVHVSGVFLPTPYTGFRAMRAGLLQDTFLEAMHVQTIVDDRGRILAQRADRPTDGLVYGLVSLRSHARDLGMRGPADPNRRGLGHVDTVTRRRRSRLQHDPAARRDDPGGGRLLSPARHHRRTPSIQRHVKVSMLSSVRANVTC